MTPRQQQLLQAIIQEFIETATAVGSVSLTDKYKFKVSPATVRNEMAELVRQGYLEQLHSSAGRVPTTLGLRYFLQELIDELDELDVVTRQKLRHELHSHRHTQEKLIRNSLNFLVGLSGNAAVALVDDDIYYSGLSEILNVPEFQEIENLRNLMVVLEDYSALQAIFQKARPGGKVKVLIGEETGLDSFSDYAIVLNNINLHGRKKGYIAVIGPNRMNYTKVIPGVEFVSQTISDLVKGW